MLSERTIQKQLADLRRECIEQSHDRELSAIAYAMECAVRRVSESGLREWGSLAQMAPSLRRGLP